MTHTWSRQSFGDEPAWATHARRIRPGESIRINRDDDGEIADDGITDRGDPLVLTTEKTLSRSQSNSLESRTVTGSSGEQQEPACQTGGGERADVEAMENGTYSPDVGNRHVRPGEGDEADEEVIEDESDDGRTTPILAEYREGHHLVRERKKEDSDSVSFPQMSIVAVTLNLPSWRTGGSRSFPKLFRQGQAYKCYQIYASSATQTS